MRVALGVVLATGLLACDGEHVEPAPNAGECQGVAGPAVATPEVAGPEMATPTDSDEREFELIYSTESTRRCPVRAVRFMPGGDEVVIAGQEGMFVVRDDEVASHAVPEPIHALVRDGDALVAFGRYGMIVRIARGADGVEVAVESEQLGVARSPLYALVRDGDVLRAVSHRVVLRQGADGWVREARGESVHELVDDALHAEMLDAMKVARIYDRESDAMVRFSEDGRSLTLREGEGERVVPIPEVLVMEDWDRPRGAFSDGRLVLWSGRWLGRLDGESWRTAEAPAELRGGFWGDSLVVHDCQRVWRLR